MYANLARRLPKAAVTVREWEEKFMAHYDIEELISRWEQEGLSVEQILGQILLHLLNLHRRLLKLEAMRRRPD